MRPIPDIFTEFNQEEASILYLKSDCDTIYMTDYFPLLESPDSITSPDLKAILIDKEKFVIFSERDDVLSYINIWKDKKKVSLFTIRDTDQKWDIVRPWIITQGYQDYKIDLLLSEKPEKVMVMWQNTILPDNLYSLSDTKMSITIPALADSIFRSSIRIIALIPDGRTTNDVLVKLQYGKVLDSTEELTRKDKQAFILYSLMIDRFNNGNKTNDRALNQPDVLPSVDYHGGDIKGITEKIKSGFFSNLGINTIWISPIAQNVGGAWGLDKDPFTRFSAYHGYWPVNLTIIDYHFATDAELREMLDEAHKNNLNVILDYVANHLHQESHILKNNPDWNTPMYLSDGRPNIRLFDEQRLTTWFDTFLPTLDLERDDVCETMTDSALYWLQTYDFDGFRHDAAKHIPEKYWRMLTKKIKQRVDNPDIFQIGETYGKPQLLRSYIKSGMLDSQFDFGIYHSAVNTFGTHDNTMKDLFKDLTRSLNSYGYHNLMGNISGNHDKPRFISVAGGTVSLKENTKAAGRKRKIEVGDTIAYRKLALLESFMFTIPGIPCIYQGDEYGVPGANDPDNRRMMQFDGYDHNELKLLEAVKKLTKIRSSSLPLIYGDLIPLYCDDDLFAFTRVYMGKKVIVAFNSSGESKELNIQLPFNASFSNLKTNFEQIIENNDDTLTILLEPYAFEILTD